MGYGLQVNDASGIQLYDSSADRFPRLVHTQTVTSSGSIDLPGIADMLTFQWIEIGYVYWAQSLGNVTISRSGTTISWAIPSGVSISAPLYVFAYT